MISPPVFMHDTVPHLSKVRHYGVLAGKRLAVKDLFHMVGLPTTAGNPDWANTHSIPAETNSIVTKMIDAGATFVGKTITDELAYSLNGINIHYGTPLNHKSPDRLPGGSSSGSAAAVACRLADIGLGTDTGGSIRVPASYNGLYGLRPTHGALETDNMVALAPSFDTVGWMTRSLDELLLVASVVLKDKWTFGEFPSFGVLRSLLDQTEHKLIIETWLAEREFASKDVLNFDPFSLDLAEAFRVLQGHEIWQQHGQWFTQHQPSMADDIRTRLAQCKEINAEQVSWAKEIQQSVIKQADALFEQNDVLIVPTTPGIAPLLDTPADKLATYRYKLLSMTATAGLAGLPQLHLPLFELDRAACGISLIGQRGSDMALIKLAKKIIES